MDKNVVISKQQKITKLRNDIFSISVNDETTKKVIQTAYEKHNVIFEPHGAVSGKRLCTFRVK